MHFCNPDLVNVRSQDLETLYHDAGQYYWYDIGKCFGTEHLDDSKLETCTTVLPESEVQDIDNESDWNMAELKFRLLQHKDKE